MIARTIIVATGNRHKLDELTQLFAAHGLEVTLRPFTDILPGFEIEESGQTFEENAYIKAALVHAATGLPTLADDSGLEVRALHGEPGVRSARYSGVSATDASNRALLLERLHGVDDREASFRCVLCYVDDARTILSEGACTGSIGRMEHGTSGFGYDPLFTHHGDDRTFAQLTADEKHARSHRGAAVAALVARIRSLDTDVIDDPLPLRDALLRASIAAGRADEDLMRHALLRVHDAHDARAMYEALLQSYLFGGFPAALDALSAFSRHINTHGIAFTPPDAAPYDEALFTERGTELCKTIYGSVYERMMDRLRDVTPDLQSWMVVEGYGKTLARPGLSTLERELCNVALLAATHRTTQLYSHVRGALLVGATDTDLADVVHIVTEHCGRIEGDAIRGIIRDLHV